MNPVKFFKCLADETRLRCVLLIEREQELCVCELTEALDEIQPKISRHLAQLRECGILIDRRQGQWIFYRVNQVLPDWAKSVLKNTLADNETFLAENFEKLHHMNDRPERTKASC